MLHPETDTAFAVWQIIIYVIAGVCVIAGILCTFLTDYVLGKIACVIGGLFVAGVIFGVWAWATWPPFDTQYHTYYPTTITVAQTNERILSDGQGNVSQRIAILATNCNTYGCDDTRCTVLTKGETVTLMCEQEWETNGVPGEVCNWGKVGTNGSA